MKKNILVTGANGFIGKELINKLIINGYKVTAHTNADGDISSCNLDYPNIEHVVHLAAMTYVPDSWVNTPEFYKVNFLGTENVLEFCRKNKCSLTFLSTYVYGTPMYNPIDENHRTVPNTPYNHSKLLAEELCKFYSDKFDVPITILRPFNIYGEGQKDCFLIPTIIRQIIDPKIKIIEVMDLRPKRDYLYIDDLISAIILTIAGDRFSVYNVGSGKSVSVEEVIKAVLAVTGIKKQYKSKNIERKHEIMDACANINKIKSELGWMPAFSLEQGIGYIISKNMRKSYEEN